MAKIITVYSLKGGTGKSTISILLAQALKNMGKSIALLDSDTQQKSLANWAEHCANDIDCFLIHNNLTKADINTFLDKDYIIIDGTPRTNTYTENILLLSDVILIPMQPTQLSLSSFMQDKHLDILQKAKNKGIKILGIINGTTYHNTQDCDDLKKILKKTPVKDVLELGYRKAFVIDYAKPFKSTKNQKAKAEFNKIVDAIL